MPAKGNYLKNLMTIRINEIVSCLACYGSKKGIKYVAQKSRQRKTRALQKRAVKIKWEHFFFKSDIYDPFQTVLSSDHSKIIILFNSYVIQAYFILNFFQDIL